MSKYKKEAIDLKDVKVCEQCQVLFVPIEPWYHTCPHCFVKNNDYCDGCIEDTF